MSVEAGCVQRLLDLVDKLQNSATLSDDIEDLTILERRYDRQPSSREPRQWTHIFKFAHGMRTTRLPDIAR